MQMEETWSAQRGERKHPLTLLELAIFEARRVPRVLLFLQHKTPFSHLFPWRQPCLPFTLTPACRVGILSQVAHACRSAVLNFNGSLPRLGPEPLPETCVFPDFCWGRRAPDTLARGSNVHLIKTWIREASRGSRKLGFLAEFQGQCPRWEPEGEALG